MQNPTAEEVESLWRGIALPILLFHNGDVEHCGWTTEEEEDYEPKGKEETSSDEDEVHYLNPGTCMWSSKSQASLIEQRNLRSSLSLFVSCRKTSRNYAKGY